MAYNKPFDKRSPDFRRVQYEFAYDSEEAAQAAFVRLRDKRYTLLDNGDYVLPVGHKIHSSDEALIGNTVRFVGKVKASDIPDGPRLREMEIEISGESGKLVSREVI